MTPEKFEYELEKARAERDQWKAEFERLVEQRVKLQYAIEELHTMVDPTWDDD